MKALCSLPGWWDANLLCPITHGSVPRAPSPTRAPFQLWAQNRSYALTGRWIHLTSLPPEGEGLIPFYTSSLLFLSPPFIIIVQSRSLPCAGSGPLCKSFQLTNQAGNNLRSLFCQAIKLNELRERFDEFRRWHKVSRRQIAREQKTKRVKRVPWSGTAVSWFNLMRSLLDRGVFGAPHPWPQAR